MKISTKHIVGSLGCLLAVSLCLCVGTGSLTWRYFSSGTNPLRELKQHFFGISIEITEGIDDSNGVPRRYKNLMLDEVLHGMQFEPPVEKSKRGNGEHDFSRLPTAYHHPEGPVGLVMQSVNWFPGPVNSFHGDARIAVSMVGQGSTLLPIATAWSEPPIGVIMMKAGTLAAYARPYQVMDFYEENPAIIRLSVPQDTSSPKFTFIANARRRGATVRVFEGNERITFDQKAPGNYYRFLFIDVIRGHTGVVCKELLTREAMQRYFKSMIEEGIVCFHTSNRDYELEPIVVSVASSLQLHYLLAEEKQVIRLMVGQKELPPLKHVEHFSSTWAFVARKPEYLNQLRALLEKRAPPPGPPAFGTRLELHERQEAGLTSHVWKDGESNSLAALKRPRVVKLRN